MPAEESSPASISKVVRAEVMAAIPPSEEIRSVIQQSNASLQSALQNIVEMTKDTHFRVTVEEEVNIIERY